MAQRNEPIPPVPYLFFFRLSLAQETAPLLKTLTSVETESPRALRAWLSEDCVISLRSDIDLEYLRVRVEQVVAQRTSTDFDNFRIKIVKIKRQRPGKAWQGSCGCGFWIVFAVNYPLCSELCHMYVSPGALFSVT